MNLSEIPKHIQAAGLYIGLPVLKRLGIQLEMKDVCQELGVDHTSILQQVRSIFFTKKVDNQSQIAEVKKLQQSLREQSFLSAVYEYQSSHPGCWLKVERHQLSDDFKVFLISKKEEFELSWGDVSRLTKIPEDTLKKIKGQNNDKNDEEPGPSSLPEQVVDKLAEFFKGRSGKASVKDFCDKNPEVLLELGLGYRSFSRLLLGLGFVSPKGIFLKNTGLDLIKRFAPGMVWGSDGKNINLVINGNHFRWVWQGLIDHKTTVLVGGVINESESSENLLEAIKRSREASGISPMAIVLDNRLSENLPVIRSYLDSMGIEIIKIFPGNSKSNGIIENNFKVFENWVHGKGGKIVINASNEKDLSREVANLMVELFTQLRNFSPRGSLGGKSASDLSSKAVPLSEAERTAIQEEIKALANRFKNELASPVMTAAKDEALSLAVEALNPPSPEVFRKKFNASGYTANLILQALAIFDSQKLKHPEKKFDHTYFGGILRNLVNQEYLQTLTHNLESIYALFWKRMNERMKSLTSKIEAPLDNCKKLVYEFLNSKVPAQGNLALIYLKNILFFLAGQDASAITSARNILESEVLNSKMTSTLKKESLIRKLIEIESQIRLIANIPNEILKNTTQVYPGIFDTVATTQ